MGVSIFREGESTVTEFQCDGDHGLFERPTIRSTAGYVEAHHSFIAAGCGETPGRVTCPECKR